MTRKRRLVMCIYILFTFTNCLYSLTLSELRKTRAEQKKKRPNMRWAVNDSIELSCLFLHCFRVRVPLRRAAPRLLKEAVMAKTKKKTTINFYLLNDNMAPLKSRVPFWTRLPSNSFISLSTRFASCVPNFPYPSSYFSLLPLFLDESFSFMLRIRS